MSDDAKYVESERAYVIRCLKEHDGCKRVVVSTCVKPTLGETINEISTLLYSGETKLEIFEEDRFLRDEWGRDAKIIGDRGSRHVKPLSGTQGIEK